MRHIIALVTALAMCSPMSAFAQDWDIESAEMTSTIVGSLTGLVVGGTAGVIVGGEIGERSCSGGFECLGPLFVGIGAGGLFGATLIGVWSGVGTYGVLRPRDGSGHWLSGSILGGATGLGLGLALNWNDPSDVPAPLMIGSMAVVGMGVGGLIGCLIPTAPSVALVPTLGGATAHVGFQF